MSEAAVPEGARGRLVPARLLSDAGLTRRAVEGDERAFAAIFDRYHQDLFRYCMAIVGSPVDAQDALQNTMVKALRALPGEERQIDLKPWLYRIAHNESIELLRRRRPTEELDPEQVSRGGSLAEDAEARERLRRLISDLEQLPERQRGALVMRELAGLDFDEIGAAFGTSPAVARQTLYEARLGLRQMDEGREMSCDVVVRALSDADGRVTRRRDIRAHLRVCRDCRRFRDEVKSRRADFAALAPLPGVAAAGLLQAVIGGSGGGSAAGSGLVGAVGGGAVKSLGGAAALKSAAAVAVVVAVGAGAADRGGVVDVTPWGGGAGQTQSERAGDAPGAPAQRHLSGQAAGSGGAQGEAGAASGGKAGAPDVEHAGSRGGSSGSDAAAKGSPGAGAGSEGGKTHPSGRGHEKQHPDAASHGQQTAAGHKAPAKGAGGNGGSSKGQSPKTARPPKSSSPTKPDKPTQPVKPAGQASPPQTGGGGQATAPPKAPAAPEAASPPPDPPSPPAEAKAPPSPLEADS